MDREEIREEIQEEIQEGVELLGRERFKILLVILVLLLAVGPFFKTTYLTHVLFGALLMYGIYVIRPRKTFLYFCLGWVLTDLTFSWIGVAFQSTTLELVGIIMDFGFLALLTALILRRVLHAPAVTGETIAGSICGYLLLGILWATGFGLLERVVPGSFPEAILVAEEERVQAHGSTIRFVYFDFVTLSTLGYGDITPQKVPAGILAALEAITGQLYLAVLIARLVAIYTGKRMARHAGKAGEDE